MNRLKQALSKIRQWFFVNTWHGKCQHLNKKEVYRDYSDAYIEYECFDCAERIFENMYNKKK
jgi:hypothetical protein